MKTLIIHYIGFSVFIRAALESLVLPVEPQYDYDEVFTIDLVGFSSLSSLIVFLNRLYIINGNVRVLLISSERSHLPILPSFSVNLEQKLSQWEFLLKNNGRIITDIIDECLRVKNLEKLPIKNRLILRQLVEGYSIEEVAEQFEIGTKSIRTGMWKCGSVYGFNCTYRFMSYLKSEYSPTLNGEISSISVNAAEDYPFLFDKKERTPNFSLHYI